MLGDSVPFGAGVEDDQTYPYYLAKKTSLKVINGGVPSYSLRQAFKRWEDDFAHIKPKIVTLHSSNDVSLLTHYKDTWTPKTTWEYHGPVRIPAFVNIALFHYSSSLIKKLRHYQSLMKKPKSEASDLSFGSPVSDDTRLMFLEKMAETIDKAIQYSLKTRAILVLIPINPMYYMIEAEKNTSVVVKHKNDQSFFNIIERVCRDLNMLMMRQANVYPHVYFFDVLTQMDTLDRNILYLDFIHHTPAGNEVFEIFFDNFLKDSGLKEKPAA